MAPITHGKSIRKKITPEYSAWNSMKTRCYNPNYPGYKYYKEKGITVCDRWLNSFTAFLEDMGERPSPLHSLDRIENDKGYYKENCRWATKAEQQRNQDVNVWYELNGERKILADWAKELNVRPQTLKAWADMEGFANAHHRFKKQ